MEWECLNSCTLEAESSGAGPRDGSKATPNLDPLPNDDDRTKVLGWSELIEPSSKKFSAKEIKNEVYVLEQKYLARGNRK